MCPFFTGTQIRHSGGHVGRCAQCQPVRVRGARQHHGAEVIIIAPFHIRYETRTNIDTVHTPPPLHTLARIVWHLVQGQLFSRVAPTVTQYAYLTPWEYLLSYLDVYFALIARDNGCLTPELTIIIIVIHSDNHPGHHIAFYILFNWRSFIYHFMGFLLRR